MSAAKTDLVRVVPAGDAAALVAFRDEMSLEVTARVHALAKAVEEAQPSALIEVVAAYSTLLVHYDPLRLSFDQLESLIHRLMETGLQGRPLDGRVREIPTVYGGPYGPDIPELSARLHLTEEEIIQMHSGASFTVCCLGFAPGQPYVIGLPPQLAMPRRERPRELVPGGSVLIANQTTVYPIANPTGWWLVGRTPLKLFDPLANPPTYLQPGDQMKFIPVTEDEYLSMGGEKVE
ncbi:MAG TPA: 5-oxoprolinase subunit PxpB [Chloroflexota bacterium]|nr:5-oxoprolinase subunit PxpB [Chloroflexota bacterium]